MRSVARTAMLVPLSLLLAAAASAANPVVSNVRASQRVGAKVVDITYDVADADSEELAVAIRVSRNGGISWDVPCTSAAGNGVGFGVTPGTGKSIVWDAGADWDGQWSSWMRVEVMANDLPTTGNYWVIDLSAGPDATDYPVSSLDAVPVGGWTDEHKTTKLVLRRLSAGSFAMGSPTDELGHLSGETQHQVTLTEDFYLGVFEVTQKQYERVMGVWPSYFNNATCRDARPAEYVSWSDVRGGVWPGVPAGSGLPAADTFVGRLRTRTGLAVDLPTESQWEYACRAGTATALNSGKNLTAFYDACPNMAEVGRYGYNGGLPDFQNVDLSGATAKVGSYLTNAWGLYDMHGNVSEWCLDWDGAYPGTVADPLGVSSGSSRVLRGGSYAKLAAYCRSAFRSSFYPEAHYSDCGFRIRSAAPVWQGVSTSTSLDRGSEKEHVGRRPPPECPEDRQQGKRTRASVTVPCRAGRRQ